MNKLILIPIAFAMLMAVAGASSPTVFIENGLTTGTQWQVYVSYAHSPSSFNVVLSGTANIPSNSLSTNALNASSLSQTYLYVAGYSVGGIYTYLTGYVNVGYNQIIYFNPNANTTNATFHSCSHNQSICSPLTGSIVTLNVSQLQNHVLGPPYSANLTIYINPAGYYEYVVQNASIGSNSKTELPQSLYLNTQPGELTNQLNLSFFGKEYELGNLNSNTSNALINSKAQAEVFYSGLIDISPIEYDMLGGNLTPQTFTNFVYGNEGSFYNTTLFYNLTTNAKQSSFLFGFFQWSINTGLSLLSGGLSDISLSGFAGLPYAETSTSITQAIPAMLATIPNTTLSYPIYVSYAYPNFICQVGQLNLGICIESGQKGMIDFNNYIDDTYAPSILMSQFLTEDVTLILGFALIIVIVKKINGE